MVVVFPEYLGTLHRGKTQLRACVIMFSGRVERLAGATAVNPSEAARQQIDSLVFCFNITAMRLIG
jgi:hypothetical protein